jgi:hypothetical protein
VGSESERRAAGDWLREEEEKRDEDRWVAAGGES